MIKHLKLFFLLYFLACNQTDNLSTNNQLLDSRLEKLEKHLARLDSELAKIQSQITASPPAPTNESTPSPSTTAAILKVSHVALSKSSNDDPFLGPVDNTKLMMAFISYESTSSRDFFKNTWPQLKRLYFDTKKVKFILRDFPLTKHAKGYLAARAANCAGEQKSYWKAFELLLSNDLEDLGKLFKDNLPQLDAKSYNRCNASTKYQREIELDKKDGLELGVKGLPAFFLLSKDTSNSYNGVLIRGAQPLNLFEIELQKLLATKSVNDTKRH
jgi:protein-disulfide isomerase